MSVIIIIIHITLIYDTINNIKEPNLLIVFSFQLYLTLGEKNVNVFYSRDNVYKIVNLIIGVYI